MFRTVDELTSLLDDAPRLVSILDATIALAVVQAERCGVQKEQSYDYRTVSQMVADRTGADPKKVRRLSRLGKWVGDFDLFGSAWTAGDLLSEHIEILKKVADTPKTHTALVKDQQQFIDWARDYDFKDYAAIVQYWVNANDPDGEEPKDQTSKTFFRAQKRHDGTVKLDGLLDPLTGAAFMTAFDVETQKLFRSQSSEEVAETDAGKQGVNALMNLVVRGSAREDGSRVEPLINIVMSDGVAEDLIKRLEEPSDDPLPVAFDDIDKRCELIDGTPLHPHYALQVMAIATFRRQIMTAAGVTLDASVNARCFTPKQKRILRVEARGRCRKRGCDAPYSWLEADHRVAHSRGGPTAVKNGTLLCSPDNKAKGNR